MDMNDSRPTERFTDSLPGSGQQRAWYPPPVDPAYADQARYAPAYGEQPPPWAPGMNDTNTTKQLPAYWQQELPPSGQLQQQGSAPPPPEGPKPPPRWLWVVAGAAVLLVVALVIALVLVNNAIKTQTAVPPLPAMPETTPPMPSPSTRTSTPRLPAPVPPTGGLPTPTESTGPAAMQDIVYSVAGEGRAISIMYIDTGGLIQTEFNVELPWTKEVSLAKSAAHPANVTIVNIGHNVTCSVTVNGAQMSKRVGVGLTICDARG
ncbi:MULTISPECIES: MmpS family transport accessory protein [unclassified Mycobacterium]|uniref:MmpS family transport accessory protein n=1 Tax=unclassified Mycobacterium TaxID=2642494 RepID=UPI0009ED2F1E|nr:MULTISPECIES: MmpS family transport accessory protein [unclassified Mycobacterium]